MKNGNFFLLGFLIFGLLISGCVPEDRPDEIQPPEEIGSFEPGSGEIGEDGRPIGWTDGTHGKKTPPNYDLLFNHDNVLRMDIVIAPEDWQAMQDDMTEKFGAFGNPFGFGSNSSFNPSEPWNLGGDENPIYIPCNLVFRGITWYHVGIRYKGNASLSTTWGAGSYKLPLRFNFDKFEDDFPEIKNQRFFGFDKLSLASSFFDNSLIREKVTNEIFRAAGVPVGRDAFCRVFIDYGEGKKYFGLYTLQEIPSEPMLSSIFIEDDGNLYKPDGSSASFRTWNPEDFDKETNEDEEDFSDVRELYDVLHSDRTDQSAFKDRLESVFNVDGFLHYLAINQVICNWDTYGQLPHNYYLYHDPGDDLLHWIPWDFNMALDAVSLRPALSLELSPLEVGQRWPLIRYLLDIPDYHARYVYYVKKTIDEIFYPQRMQTILDGAYDLISPYVLGDYGEVYPYTNLSRLSHFDDAFTELRNHVTNRYEAARQFVQNYQDEPAPPDDTGADDAPTDSPSDDAIPSDDAPTDSPTDDVIPSDDPPTDSPTDDVNTDDIPNGSTSSHSTSPHRTALDNIPFGDPSSIDS